MRLVIAAAMALAAAPAAAQSLAPVALGPGEVLLEIGVRGRSVTQATSATLAVSVVGRGATAAAARADNEARSQRLIAAARAAGVRSEDVSRGPARFYPGFVGNEAMEEDASIGFVSDPRPQAPPGAQTERSTVKIRLRDFSSFERLRDALEAAGAEDVPMLVYELGDQAVARQAAKADALRNARAEAAAYAKDLGMRIQRLVRVSDRIPPGERTPTMADVFRLFIGEGESATREIETTADIAVDFVLGPER
jgi:hypothetical protein